MASQHSYVSIESLHFYVFPWANFMNAYWTVWFVAPDPYVKVVPEEEAENLLSDSSTHQCKHCDFKAALKSKFTRHAAMHRHSAKFKCTLCSYSAPKQWQLRTHTTIHHKTLPSSALQSNSSNCFVISDTDGEYSCTKCEYTATTETAMKRHMFHHTHKGNIQCIHCSFTANTHSMLHGHVRSGHKLLLKSVGRKFGWMFSYKLYF